MNNERLTLWIDGREVLPVRAIPYVTLSPRFQPDILARRFAGNDLLREDQPPKPWPLSAYFLVAGVWYRANRGEWEAVVKCVDGFQAGLQGEFFTRNSGYAVWRYGGAAALPAGWFVLYDDFLKTFRADLEGRICKGRPLREDELTISPEIDEITRAIIMEGFDEIAENEPVKPQTDESGTAIAANSPEEDPEEALAALFDPVTPEALEKMFPSGNKWSTWADRAGENGLIKARVGRRLFNPYKAGIWFLGRGVPEWDRARCHRKLAENLPPRSRDMEYLLTGKLE